ncbi:MAG: RluA family pseudouridine synthase [Deltaproteobacteria bacterium]|nr:RluA family pseudouridine synthase [Deltaproteobacteria bacterium]
MASPPLTIVVPAEVQGQRLDVFLVRTLAQASRERVRELIAAGGVRVNGHRRAKGTRVAAGDVLFIEGWDAAGAAAPAANPSLSLSVLYQDAEVLVLDKPAGMPTHALRSDERHTLANFLLAQFPELSTVGKDLREPGLVHRLDTDTSGVVLVARTAVVWGLLREQFTRRQVHKEYVALVAGEVVHGGEIRTAIAHDRRHRRRMRVCTSAEQAAALRARPAITSYRPLQRLPGATLLAVEIATGVMHQVRVHLASIGHPLVGDRLYGGPPAARHMLHASCIAFVHPRTGARVRVESAPPEDFQVAVASRGGQVRGRLGGG